MGHVGSVRAMWTTWATDEGISVASTEEGPRGFHEMFPPYFVKDGDYL